MNYARQITFDTNSLYQTPTPVYAYEYAYVLRHSSQDNIDFNVDNNKIDEHTVYNSLSEIDHLTSKNLIIYVYAV